ncbi:MAG: 2-oxoglutarate dehydrogenase complex dihydrolipoyllysine-residue succinyltransferase [Rhodobacteraceae bacterium]|nr:2-oxoglutarate dehydrogenase complex dihydrolipoyllysine-residue succinyltransferase [Paracoccaceae bacterium]
MLKEVRVPTLGESIAEATVGSWMKQAGDAVAADEPLCELETDKVAIEVPSPATGVLSEIVAAAGSAVEVDALLAMIEEGAVASKPASAPAAPPPAKPAAAAAARPAAPRDVEDAPSARRMMAEHKVEPTQVAGSGRQGRRMKEDVLATLAAQAAVEAPPPARGTGALEERVPMSRLRRTIARRLKEAQNTAAMLTTYNEVDMSRVMQLRTAYKDTFADKHGVKLGFMSFFVKACCTALLEVPEVNAELDGHDIVYRSFVNMGIAVGTPSGLVVPVLRNANQMSFAEIERSIVDLGTRARGGNLSLGDMQGGTFSISNGGVYGSLMSSPILNPPQSGILGMHKIQQRPVAEGGEVVIRPMMYLALSYDHRIVDGQGAVTFLVRVKESIEDPRRLLLEL